MTWNAEAAGKAVAGAAKRARGLLRAVFDLKLPPLALVCVAAVARVQERGAQPI